MFRVGSAPPGDTVRSITVPSYVAGAVPYEHRANSHSTGATTPTAKTAREAAPCWTFSMSRDPLHPWESSLTAIVHTVHRGRLNTGAEKACQHRDLDKLCASDNSHPRPRVDALDNLGLIRRARSPMVDLALLSTA